MISEKHQLQHNYCFEKIAYKDAKEGTIRDMKNLVRLNNPIWLTKKVETALEVFYSKNIEEEIPFNIVLSSNLIDEMMNYFIPQLKNVDTDDSLRCGFEMFRVFSNGHVLWIEIDNDTTDQIYIV